MNDHFEWSEGGLGLLAIINSIIEENGGNEAMAEIIIDEQYNGDSCQNSLRKLRQKILTMYGHLTVKEIAGVLEVNESRVNTIISEMRELGIAPDIIKKRRRGRVPIPNKVYNDNRFKYTAEEIAFIKDNFPTKSSKEIGDAIGRSKWAINSLVYNRFPELKKIAGKRFEEYKQKSA